MVVVWIFMMSCLVHDHLAELKACKEENMKPQVCRKFDPKPVEKKWW